MQVCRFLCFYIHKVCRFLLLTRSMIRFTCSANISVCGLPILKNLRKQKMKILPGGGVIFYIRHNFFYVTCSFFYIRHNFRGVWRKFSVLNLCICKGVLHTSCTPPPKARYRSLKGNPRNAAFFAYRRMSLNISLNRSF